jgi:cytochrome c-type biogenesis protein CcsB
MAAISSYLVVSALIALIGSFLAFIAYTATKRKDFGQYASLVAYLGYAFLTAAVVTRWIAAGRAPYSNQYEFAVAFAWGVMTAYVYIERQFRVRALGAFVVPVPIGLLIYARTLPDQVSPLIPALQNNLLLTVHVAMAVIAYGAFAVACGGAIMYLVQRNDRVRWLPFREDIDMTCYRAVMLGFPCMALVLILGAAWGNVAWGRYWGWDPKETAALTTWLIYAGYLHAHSLKSWRGTRSSVLLLLGFGATLFTYYGNLFLGGLHAYSGL